MSKTLDKALRMGQDRIPLAEYIPADCAQDGTFRAAWSARIRKARLAAGHRTASGAARSAGIDITQYGQLEMGVRIPSFAVLHRLIWVMGLDPEILFAPVTPDEADLDSTD